MPKFTVKLASNYENISRPVAMSIARDVLKVTDIPDTTDVFMPGEFEQVGQAAAKLGVSDDVQLESSRKVKITVTDRLRNESVMNAIIRQNEMPAMLEDRVLGISIRPVYIPSDVTMNFTYFAPSRVEAQQWRDEFAARRAENRTSLEHEIGYDIPMQDGVLRILAHLHELREKTAGYGEDFLEYFRKMQRRPFELTKTMDGDINKSIVTIPEKQANAQGWFDFSDIPVEEKSDGNSIWKIEFTYKVMYHRCTHLYVVAPMMIHQSMLSSKLLDTRPRYSLDELPQNGSIGVTALDIIRKANPNPMPADGIRFPAFDEWIPNPRSQPPFTLPSMSWLLRLDPKDSQDLFNLAEMPKIRFTKEMDTYLRKMHDVLHLKGRSTVLFTLYRNGSAMAEEMISIDKDLNVRANTPLDLRSQYHIRLSFPTYYPLFTKAAIRSMQVDPYSTLQVFKTIVPALDTAYAMSILLDGQYLPRSYIKWFYKYLEDKGTGFDLGSGSGPGGIGSVPSVSTGGGEAGGLPNGGTGGDNGGGSNSGGTGGSGGTGDAESGTPGSGLISPGPGPGGGPGGDKWGPGDHWSYEGVRGNKYVQFLSIVAMR